MSFFKKIAKPLCLQKARKIAKHCSNYVKGDVLDVGAGRCLIAKEIQDVYKVKVTCIDVNDLNETSLDLIVYDGKSIPFRNNRFDNVLLVYVLHHCEDPIAVLKECKRVCKSGGKIIIFEDFGFIWFTYLMDIIANKLHNVATPLNFKTEKEWKYIFKDNGLNILKVHNGVEKQWFYPFVEHKMFVLKVNK